MAQLQNATAAFIFLMKILEVAFLITLTSLIVSSGNSLVDAIIEEEIFDRWNLSEEQEKRNA